VTIVFNYSGMASTLAFGFSRVGTWFILLAPLLGWIGVALSGSNTSTNALFGGFQYAVGGLLHMPLLLLPFAGRGFRPRLPVIAALGLALFWQTLPAVASLRVGAVERASRQDFWFPAVGFLDKARVAQTNVNNVCVPAGCYRGVLVVDEWAPLAQPQDGHQFKYHAPGVGVVRIVGKGGTEQETLVLTKIHTLTDDEMAAATARTLKLDQRAYKLARDVYGQTAFAQVRPGTDN